MFRTHMIDSQRNEVNFFDMYKTTCLIQKDIADNVVDVPEPKSTIDPELLKDLSLKALGKFVNDIASLPTFTGNTGRLVSLTALPHKLVADLLREESRSRRTIFQLNRKTNFALMDKVASHYFNGLLDRRNEYVKQMKKLTDKMAEIFYYKSTLHVNRTEKYCDWLREDFLGILCYPYLSFRGTVTERYELMTAVIASTDNTRISVAKHSQTNDKRTARKIGKFIGWVIDCFYPEIKDKERNDLVTLAAKSWDFLHKQSSVLHVSSGSKIIDVYADEGCRIHSCMTDNPFAALELYADNPDVARIVYTVNDKDRVSQRAMLFKTNLKTDNGDEIWSLDRTYTGDSDLMQGAKYIPDCVTQQGKLADMLPYYKLKATNGDEPGEYLVILPYDKDKSAARAYESETEQAIHIKLAVLGIGQFVPYMDTFCSVNADCKNRILTMYREDRGWTKGIDIDYHSQNSGGDHTVYWEDGANDQDRDEDDSDEVYSEFHGEYLHRDNAVWSDNLDSYIDPESDYVSYASDRDDYIHVDDACYCERCGCGYDTSITSFYPRASDYDIRYDSRGDEVCENCANDNTGVAKMWLVGLGMWTDNEIALDRKYFSIDASSGEDKLDEFVRELTGEDGEVYFFENERTALFELFGEWVREQEEEEEVADEVTV